MARSRGREISVELPEKLAWVFAEPSRYKGAFGGRGSGKSIGFASMAVVECLQAPHRFLCCRELQTSIDDSVHSEITAAIERLGVEREFVIGRKYIRAKRSGGEFLFEGLRYNYREIKSKQGITRCWVEEAEAVSEESWRTLIPTIRAAGSQIWLTWNPERKDSATHRRFIDSPPENSRIVRLNWRDNPWFPAELEEERREDQRRDPDLYAHVWEGELLTRSDAQVLNGKWRVDSFEPGPDWSGPYYGLDFGFAQDPTAAVRCWVHDEVLYVEFEAGSRRLDLSRTAGFLLDRIPGIGDHAIRADSARPESISHLASNGLPRIRAVRKWAGSVEDGIAHLRRFREIVIHPRCRETAREARLYSYKVDRLTGDVLPQVVDAHNHYIDAIRYALEPMIRARQKWGVL